MFGEIINPFLNVRNKVKDKDGTWVDQTKPREILKSKYESRVEVSGDIDVPIFSVWNKRVVLDSMSFGTNTDVYPMLWGEEIYADGNLNFRGNLFTTTTRTGGGSSSYPIVLSAQGNGENDYLDLIYWNQDTKTAQVILKKPIILPQGAELRFRSTSQSEGTLSYKVIWREIEE